MPISDVFRDPDYDPESPEYKNRKSFPSTRAGLLMGVTIGITSPQVSMDTIGGAIVAVEDEAGMNVILGLSMQIRKRLPEFIPGLTDDEYDGIVFELTKPNYEKRKWAQASAETKELFKNKDKPAMPDLSIFGDIDTSSLN